MRWSWLLAIVLLVPPFAVATDPVGCAGGPWYPLGSVGGNAASYLKWFTNSARDALMFSWLVDSTGLQPPASNSAITIGVAHADAPGTTASFSGFISSEVAKDDCHTVRGLRASQRVTVAVDAGSVGWATIQHGACQWKTAPDATGSTENAVFTRVMLANSQDRVQPVASFRLGESRMCENAANKLIVSSVAMHTSRSFTLPATEPILS